MLCSNCSMTMDAHDLFCRRCGASSPDGPFSREALLLLGLIGSSLAVVMTFAASLYTYLGADADVVFAVAISGAAVSWLSVSKLIRKDRRARMIGPQTPAATTKRDIDTEAITKHLDD